MNIKAIGIAILIAAGGSSAAHATDTKTEKLSQLLSREGTLETIKTVQKGLETALMSEAARFTGQKVAAFSHQGIDAAAEFGRCVEQSATTIDDKTINSISTFFNTPLGKRIEQARQASITRELVMKYSTDTPTETRKAAVQKIAQATSGGVAEIVLGGVSSFAGEFGKHCQIESLPDLQKNEQFIATLKGGERAMAIQAGIVLRGFTDEEVVKYARFVDSGAFKSYSRTLIGAKKCGLNSIMALTGRAAGEWMAKTAPRACGKQPAAPTLDQVYSDR